MLNYAKFSISSRGPQLWNKILSDTKKHVSNPFIFKAQKKPKKQKQKTLFSTDNDLEIFYIQEFNKMMELVHGVLIMNLLKNLWFLMLTITHQ